MKIIVDTVENCAKLAAAQYQKLLSEKPDAILGLATGSTPLKLYEELVRLNRAGEISFKQAKSFNLDEYVGLDGTHDQSYRYFMDKNLFEQVDIAMENTRVPNGKAEAGYDFSQYDKEIDAAGGIDLQLLGIGPNAHIGFNEPGEPFKSFTHVQKLTDKTRQANARFFVRLDDVPTHAVSMGLVTIMHAREILLMAFGKGKAQAVRDMLGEITPEVPASILQLHPNVTVYADAEAASLL